MFIFRPYDLMNKNQPSNKLLSSVVGIFAAFPQCQFFVFDSFFLNNIQQ